MTKEILEYTAEFVGGVAVSFGNPILRKKAEQAVDNLLTFANCKVNIHHIISDNESVDEFLKVEEKYGDDIYYHVLLNYES